MTAKSPASNSASKKGNSSQTSQRETLRFYTDDAPGLKIGPTTVLILSIVFIASVVLLHIYGKIVKA